MTTGVGEGAAPQDKKTMSVLHVFHLDRERFLALPGGICSGVTKLIIGHPFDTIKVRMQTETRFKGPFDCLMQTIRREGFIALYKGATPPLLGWTIMDATQWFALTNFRHILQKYLQPGEKLSVGSHALAGLGSGIVVSFVACPVEVLKAKLQVQYEGTRLYRGPFDAARSLIRNHGVAGIYQGLIGCLMFRSFFWVLWGSYEIYTRELTKRGFNSSWTAFLAGGLAANTFWAVSYPFDVVKNRMMAQKDPGKGAPRSLWKYPTVKSCFRDILHKDGLKGFYRGFVPCFLRSFPTNGAAIFVFETVNSYIHSTFQRPSSHS